mmetsp:Transcript_25101/g.37544  ORF Transcript_25101/g.37544 Transcript_25101/m.37544 type:complete len:95 (-) Transcript_25101:408-692(-)
MCSPRGDCVKVYCGCVHVIHVMDLFPVASACTSAHTTTNSVRVVSSLSFSVRLWFLASALVGYFFLYSCWNQKANDGQRNSVEKLFNSHKTPVL